MEHFYLQTTSKAVFEANSFIIFEQMEENFALVTTFHVLNITILNTSSLPDERPDRGVGNVRVHTGIINSASGSARRNDSDLNAIGDLKGGENLDRLKSKVKSIALLSLHRYRRCSCEKRGKSLSLKH